MHVTVAYNVACFEALFNFNDTNFISVIGKKTYKYWKIQDNSLKAEHSAFTGPVNLSQEFSCHAWLELKGMILCTSDGQIYYHDETGNFKFELEQSMPGWSIECIKSFSKGFVIGGDNLTIYIFTQTEVAGVITFEKTKTLTIKAPNIELKEVKIKNLCIDTELEDKIICVTNNRQMYRVKMKNEAKNPYGEKMTQFEPVSLPVHCNRITSMDVCIRKPLIATTSYDKTLKVWNYDTKDLEHTYTFAETAYSLAFHPSGLHCVVGFSDKLKLMNLFLDIKESRRDLKEIPAKGHKEIRFSNGGHLFAVSCSNPQTIYIYNFYTCENPSHLIFKGHSGKVKCLEWSKDDLFLYSCGTDGILYQWKMIDGGRNEIVPKGPILNSVAKSNDDKIFVVINDKRSLVEHSFQEGNEKRVEGEHIYGEVVLTKSNKMIFCGLTEDETNPINSSVKCFRNPPTNYCDTFTAHNEFGIQKLRVTHDDNYLVSAGKDGTVC
jgi:WD40 repeat protein